MLIEYGVWVARLVLCVVFGLSAWGKLADRSATRQAVGDFGVPLRWVPVVAWGLPIAEAMIAVALLLPRVSGLAAVAALLLLAVFTAAILRLLRRGERPSCSCFGAVSAMPIGPKTLARNGVLLVLAAAVGVGALTHPRLPMGLPADNAVGCAVVAALAAMLAWLAGQLRALRRRVDEQALSTLGAEGLPVGSVAPEFELLDARDGKTTLEGLLTGDRSVLLVFVHPGCDLCAALARELPRWHARTGDALTIVAVGNGDAVEQAAWGIENGLGEIPSLVQQGNEAALRYRVRGTPSAVLIDPDGRVAAPVARGGIAIRELIRTAKAARRPRPPERNETPAGISR
ncbi:redoxin domain-containing protein [Nocardia sp. NBC_00508]|uniref:MauE/DoxX family redox-associated membrane protein n=1 Tax=Nocardia sp. NBC_00508 TaxID=2975992 RepID=UPI002E806C43|nr:MauE/DoxX family redox-associated membrane protein [Nocardia sp. NBC_00508]WUD69532.1 redoxin domain-containing protein [Nocardia sp. NBC_00508]